MVEMAWRVTGASFMPQASPGDGDALALTFAQPVAPPEEARPCSRPRPRGSVAPAAGRGRKPQGPVVAAWFTAIKQ
jgi:hypothetical protein